MSVDFESAFNLALNLQSMSVTYHQQSTDTDVTISAAPSNYFRNLQMLENTVSEGREFVISKNIFSANFAGVPVRGDRIIHSELGNFTITESREMVAFNKVIGYRVRCD